MTGLHPEATVTSTDGTEACDLKSRDSMLHGLSRMERGNSVLFLSGCSTGLRQNICGEMIVEQRTEFTEEKAKAR